MASRVPRLLLLLLSLAAPLRAAVLFPASGGASSLRLYPPAPTAFVEVLSELQKSPGVPPLLARLGSDPDLLGPYAAHLARDYPDAKALLADFRSPDVHAREIASLALSIAAEDSLASLEDQGYTLAGKAYKMQGQPSGLQDGVLMVAQLQEVHAYLETYAPVGPPASARAKVKESLARARTKALAMVRGLQEAERGDDEAEVQAAVRGDESQREAIRLGAEEFLEEENGAAGWRTSDLLSVYGRLGFVQDRQSGSHIILRHVLFPDLRAQVVGHSGDLAKGYYRDLRDMARELASRLGGQEASASAAGDGGPGELDAFVRDFLRRRYEVLIEPPAPMQTVPEEGLAVLTPPVQGGAIVAAPELLPVERPGSEPGRRSRMVIILDRLGIEELDEAVLRDRRRQPILADLGDVFDQAMTRGVDWASRSIVVFGQQSPPVEKALERAREDGVEVERHWRPRVRSGTLPDLLLDGVLVVRRDREQEPPYPGGEPRDYVIVTDSPDYVRTAQAQVSHPTLAAWRGLQERALAAARRIRGRLGGGERVVVVDESGSLPSSPGKTSAPQLGEPDGPKE